MQATRRFGRFTERRRGFTVAVGLLLIFVLGPYAILPVALDRLDGTTAPRGALSDSLLPEGDTTMETRFLTRPEGTIAYDDSGAPGPLVLAVPSMGDLRQEYRFLRPHLVAAGYRVVTMDVRGHGESSVGWADYSAAAVGSDIVALLRHLDAGPAFVVGTSMAGGATVWAAAEAPELVAGQALIGPFVRDHPEGASKSAATELLIKTLFAGPWGVPAWSMYYKSLYPTAPPADLGVYRGALKANLREPGRFAALRAMLAASKAACEARLGKVSAPTLVIMGTKDPDFPRPEAEARWLSERLGGKVLMVEGAGHYPHAELPDQVGPAIVTFLAGVAGGRVARA